MTRKEIIKKMDIKDNDKIIYISIRNMEDGVLSQKFQTYNFESRLEIIGILEVVKIEKYKELNNK